MSEKLEVELVSGGPGVTNELDRAADAAAELAEVYTELAGGMGRTTTASKSNTQQIDKEAKQANKAAEAWAKLAEARREYNEAVESGNKAMMMATAHNVEVAQRAVDEIGATRGSKKASPFTGGKGIGGRADRMYRMLDDIKNPPAPSGGGGGGGGKGIGGAIANLAAGAFGNAIGNALSTMSMAAVIGFSVAITAAGAAVAGFGKSILEAKDYLGEYGSAKFGSGGNARDAGMLAGLGMAFGKSPGDMAAEARSFGKGLMDSPFAASYAVEAGINPLAGPYGDVNYAKKLNLAYRDLSSKKYTDEEAFRRAEAMNLDVGQLGLLRNASPNIRAQALSWDASVSQEQMTAGADSTLQFNMAMGETQRLLVEIGTFGLPLLNEGLRQVSMVLRGLQFGLDAGSRLFTDPYGLSGLTDAITGASSSSSSANGNKAALDTNSQAVTDNTKAITNLTGAIGYGSTRFKGSLPAGATRYENAVAYLQGQSAALGAISL